MFRAEKAKQYVEKRHKYLVKEEKKGIRARIRRAINEEETYCRYNDIYAPTGQLYPEVRKWLISLGYKVEASEVEDEWIVSWE